MLADDVAQHQKPRAVKRMGVGGGGVIAVNQSTLNYDF